MNTQEIKINIPEGKKAIYDEATQTIKFVDIAAPKSKNFLEFCQNHPDTFGEYYFDSLGHVRKDNVGYERSNCITYLKTEEDAKGILALIQLIRFRDEWNEGWKPDWTKPCFKPYFPIFVIYYKSNFAEVGTNYGFRRILAFKDKETAKLFKDTFIDLIEQAKNFI